jgi:Spx/MgsR family transcriptional regulator
LDTGPLTLYGIASCDTCRKARKWLTANSYDHEFHDLRDDGLDMPMLKRWAGRISWEKLLNTRSLTWRKIPEVDRADMSQEKALASMLEHPTLVKRPVLECEEFISVGFSPENYKAMFMQL